MYSIIICTLYNFVNTFLKIFLKILCRAQARIFCWLSETSGGHRVHRSGAETKGGHRVHQEILNKKSGPDF